ncbi:MAG: NERD domain-containing protein [Betaproteobacteria bacterium]|nr:NERD domain-containing protein [Betaproteobacteria bacterium]
MSREKRSPIKDKPLRNPGQSVERQLDDLIDEKFAFPLAMGLVVIAFTLIEYWRYYYPQTPSPRTATAVAILFLGWAALQMVRAWPKLQNLSLALKGEKAVGQYLERLREHGYQVFHDVIGSSFNVDHVIVGPAGIFTIETKTISKPPGPEAKVIFDGECVVVGGFEPDRDPVIQAKAQSTWLCQLLFESTGRKYLVRPVVVFPGWWVQQSKGSTREMWVLEPKALPGFLAHEPDVLTSEDVKLASFHLSRFIRSS